MKRSDFDSWIPVGSPLRTLARNIASMDAEISQTFLTDPTDKPHNFLSNGEVGANWRVPRADSAEALALWKFDREHQSVHGFCNKYEAYRGVALLFDPLVDAFLAAHLLSRYGGRIPVKASVIVLSDYYPLSKSNVLSSVGDWGLDETIKILNGIVSDHTTTQLFGCLADGKSFEKNGVIKERIAAHRVLLWNFFPMFRGGDKTSDWSGLPRSGAWRECCWNFLCRFLAALDAQQVIIACGQPMFPNPYPDGTQRNRYLCRQKNRAMK